MSTWVPPRWLKPALFVLALLPALWVVAAIASDYFNGTRLLGSNPIKEAEHFTGRWVLRFLVITLSVTPIRQTLGWNWLQRYRRMFGLFAFTYAAIHLTIYFVLDLELIWGDLWADIVKRPYITIGMAALLSLIPLAATSTTGMIRRLGARNWTRLHRLAYVAAVCGVLHYTWLAKVGVKDPYWYATALGVLLGVRVWELGRRAMRRRHATAAVSSRAENPLSRRRPSP